MRQARAQDAWRRSTEADRGFRATRIRAIGKAPLADFDEEVPNGLLILCGLNGVGKTTLLRLIEGVFRGRTAMSGRTRPELLADGDFIVSLEFGADSRECALGEEPEDEPTVALLDAFSLCSRMNALLEQPNFEDLLEGVEAYEYDPNERAAASYVVGRQYDAIRVYEVEDTTREDETTIPVFEAESGGITYRFNALGQGEITALAALWYLNRLEGTTLVLVEEPETFLSARSAVAFMDVLAEQVHKKRLYAIVTTHSIEVVTRAALSTVRVLRRTDDGVILRQPRTGAELELMLGAYVGQSRVVFVEDRTARTFFGELMARYEGLWGQSLDVVDVGGASEVVEICRRVPGTPTFRGVGVLDGDQPAPDAAQLRSRVFVLPGGASPDAILRDAALNNRELFSARLARERGPLEAALEVVGGRDIHDWFPDLAAQLGTEERAVVRAAIDCWLAVSENEEAARGLVRNVTTALIEPQV